jgi:hypothetical protein
VLQTLSAIFPVFPVFPAIPQRYKSFHATRAQQRASRFVPGQLQESDSMMIKQFCTAIVVMAALPGVAQAEPVKNASSYCLSSMSAAADNSDPEIALKNL